MNSSRRRKASSGSKAANKKENVKYDSSKRNPEEEKLMLAALLKSEYDDLYSAYTVLEVADQFVVGDLGADKVREYTRPADASGGDGAAKEEVLMDYDIHFLAKVPHSDSLHEVHISATARKPDGQAPKHN